MEEFFLKILHYIIWVLKTTTFQLFLMLGPLLLLALVMNYLSGINESLGYKLFGKKIYTYVFASLGTAIHELGHAVFAVIFGHKITQITLFSPKSNGTLGSVEHSYNPKNIYHNIGNFFIGIGPVILGSLIMYLLAYQFFGNYIQAIDTNLNSNTVRYIPIVLKNMFLELRSSGWKDVMFLYVLYSIGSSITLSKVDIINARSGLIYFIMVVLIFNFSTLWLGNEATKSIMDITEYFSGFYTVLIFSIILNILFVIFLYILNMIRSVFI